MTEERSWWEGNMEHRMDKVEEGVANFREFQVEMRAFTVRADEREEQRVRTERRRARIHFWLLSLVGAIVVSGMAAFFSWMVNFMETHHIS